MDGTVKKSHPVQFFTLKPKNNTQKPLLIPTILVNQFGTAKFPYSEQMIKHGYGKSTIQFFLMEQPTIFIGAIVLQIEKLVHYRAFTIVEEYFSTNRYYRWKHMLVRTVGWKQFDLRYEIHYIRYCCIQYFVNKKRLYKVQNTERIQDAQITNLT